jgi:hypothetical protein
MYLDYAEFQAKRQIPMTMEDWALRLNKFLNEAKAIEEKSENFVPREPAPATDRKWIPAGVYPALDAGPR